MGGLFGWLVKRSHSGTVGVPPQQPGLYTTLLDAQNKRTLLHVGSVHLIAPGLTSLPPPLWCCVPGAVCRSSSAPRRDRPRRSTATMVRDPFTLVVALDESGRAEGDLYLDDGHSFAFTKGAFLHRQ